jgi:hypothetical protein
VLPLPPEAKERAVALAQLICSHRSRSFLNLDGHPDGFSFSRVVLRFPKCSLSGQRFILFPQLVLFIGDFKLPTCFKFGFKGFGHFVIGGEIGLGPLDCGFTLFSQLGNVTGTILTSSGPSSFLI